jgi:hypothetical protein
MTISKSLVNGSLAVLNSADAMAIWPVDETGRNSVMPSIMAKTMAWK